MVLLHNKTKTSELELQKACKHVQQDAEDGLQSNH